MRFIENLNISRAIKSLSAGGFVIIPTETVYGIVGNAFNKDTFLKLNKIKKRPQDKKFTLFVKDGKEIAKYSILDEIDREIIKKMMPGPLTFVLRAKNLPDYLISEDGTVGFRIPKGKMATQIINNVDFPLISTSANISGEETLYDINAIKKLFGKDVAVYLKGNVGGNIPSTVINRDKNIKILRRGPYKVSDFIEFGMKIAVKKELRVLFVCYANIVRSPIAEFYFKKHFNCSVRSAGVDANEGRFPTKEAIEVAKTLGIDVTHHSSKKLRNEDMEWADIIFATDNMVRATIYDVFGYSSKVRLISDFSEKMRGDLIPDPYKFGLNAYYKMIKILKYHLDELLKWTNRNIDIF